MDFDALAGPDFDPSLVDPEVRRFYEQTVGYDMDVWAEWGGLFKSFAWLLISLVSRDIQQFNLPLTPLESSRGISSDVLRLADRLTGEVQYTGWLRQVRATGHVLFAGFYTLCRPPGSNGAYVKVVFPLPGGSVTVLLRPENLPDGSFRLVSAGRRFGEPGYYRLFRASKEQMRVRYLPLKESIHVYTDEAGSLRTDHLFYFWGSRLLSLHYKIAQKPD